MFDSASFEFAVVAIGKRTSTVLGLLNSVYCFLLAAVLHT